VRNEPFQGEVSATAFEFSDDFASDIGLDIFVSNLPAAHRAAS
jgi:hypothetical protein